MQQQPLLPARPAPAGAHQHETTAQLLAMQVDVQLARSKGPRRIIRLTRLPGTGVPDDDVPAAVLAGRDDPFEVQVLDRMVLDPVRRAPHCRVERGPLRYRPTDQYTLDLQPE